MKPVSKKNAPRLRCARRDLKRGRGYGAGARIRMQAQRFVAELDASCERTLDTSTHPHLMTKPLGNTAKCT